LKNWMWLALFLPGVALAQDIGRPITDPAVPQTHSVEQADAKLLQVKKDRDVTETEFVEAEKVCYTKFFVNNCLDKAKEKRRARLADIRAVEVEANYFKRRHAVELRDRDLEDRAQKDAAEEAQRLANPKPQRADPSDKPAPKPDAITPEQRQARHDAEEKKRVAKEAAEAPKRAASAAAFERRKAESEKRQAEVAQKKAEKDEKKRKREAAKAEEAAKDAAAAQKPAGQ